MSLLSPMTDQEGRTLADQLQEEALQLHDETHRHELSQMVTTIQYTDHGWVEIQAEYLAYLLARVTRR